MKVIRTYLAQNRCALHGNNSVFFSLITWVTKMVSVPSFIVSPIQIKWSFRREWISQNPVTHMPTLLSSLRFSERIFTDAFRPKPSWMGWAIRFFSFQSLKAGSWRNYFPFPFKSPCYHSTSKHVFPEAAVFILPPSYILLKKKNYWAAVVSRPNSLLYLPDCLWPTLQTPYSVSWWFSCLLHTACSLAPFLCFLPHLATGLVSMFQSPSL